jgi:flagellar protein FliS
MNAMTRGALNAYSQVGIETSIASASPHKLIAMLYDGALIAIANAKGHMLRNEIAPKGEAISKAIAIIDQGLKASLNEEVGGDLAQNLKALYEYMSNRLLMANLKNDVSGLDEVSLLLGELKSAWEQIGQPAQVVAPPVVEKPASSARPSMSYGKA